MVLDNTGNFILVEYGVFISKNSYHVTIFNKKKSCVSHTKIMLIQ